MRARGAPISKGLLTISRCRHGFRSRAGTSTRSRASNGKSSTSFATLGFAVAWGPEVELEQNNFEKLAFPPDHPATDMQDSFVVDVEGGDAKSRVLLRTHTSNVQVREMSTHEPPLAVVSGGPVYRRDDDVTHSPMFHQIEGFVVDERTSFAELKGVLTEFARRFYGESTPVRFRPSYFPFVEPGAEMDVGCVFCKPDDGSRASCRVCKGTGWLEILGSGMIHPGSVQELRHRSRAVPRIRVRHGRRSRRDAPVRHPEHPAPLRKRPALPRTILSRIASPGRLRTQTGGGSWFGGSLLATAQFPACKVKQDTHVARWTACAEHFPHGSQRLRRCPPPLTHLGAARVPELPRRLPFDPSRH